MTKFTKNLFPLLVFLFTSLLCGNLHALTNPFLKNQSYFFGPVTISGSDGTLALFKHYSTTQFFRLVAYQVADGKIDNSVHVLAVVDNSGIPWGDVDNTQVDIEVSGTLSTTNSSITSGTPGYVDILINDSITVPNGPQTIKIKYTMGLVDGSILELSSEIKLNVL